MATPSAPLSPSACAALAAPGCAATGAVEGTEPGADRAAAYSARPPVWTTPYGGSPRAPCAALAQREPAERDAGSGPLDDGARGPCRTAQQPETGAPEAGGAVWPAPGTPAAAGAGLAAALARRVAAEEAEAAALAWLSVRPINLPPTEPPLGVSEVFDELFVKIFRENQKSARPRVHCFAAFAGHSLATTARCTGDALFDLPSL
jgi:hypothetical protein